MDNRVKILGPKVIGKIDLSKIDSSTRPKKPKKGMWPTLPKCREDLDSGWGIAFRMVQRNFKK